MTEPTTESNNPPLPDTDRPLPDPDFPNPGRYEKRDKPRRSSGRRTSLLSRDDWGTAFLLAGLIGIVSFITGWLGAFLGGAWH